MRRGLCFASIAPRTATITSKIKIPITAILSRRERRGLSRARPPIARPVSASVESQVIAQVLDERFADYREQPGVLFFLAPLPSNLFGSYCRFNRLLPFAQSFNGVPLPFVPSFIKSCCIRPPRIRAGRFNGERLWLG